MQNNVPGTQNSQYYYFYVTYDLGTLQEASRNGILDFKKRN